MSSCGREKNNTASKLFTFTGMCAGSVLTCSKHLYQWDMRTGEAAGPAENDLTLLRYDVKVEGGDVYARIESELVYEYEDDEDEDDFEW